MNELYVRRKLMQTKVLKPTPESLALAAEILQKGGLVAFPTETVYGLGADATNAEASAWGGATSVTGSNVEVISPRFGISKSGISRCRTPCQASTASPPSRPSFFRDSIRPACFRLNRLYFTAKRETPRSCRDLIDPAESFKPRRPQNHTTTRTAHAFAFIPFRVYTVQCQSTDSSPFPSNATQSPCKRTHAGT